MTQAKPSTPNPAPSQSYWKQTASKISQPTNPEWENLLQSSLNRCQPSLLETLQSSGDLEAYLKVRVDTATNQHQSLLEAGMSDQEATELVLGELLEQPEEPTAETDAETEDEDELEANEELAEFLSR